MVHTLQRLKNITEDCCVTLIMNTHRTLPDNEKDPIVLKNLLKEADKQLSAYDKQTAAEISQQLHSLAAGVDHRKNLESLVLFVSKGIAEYTRLPIAVTDRVVVDKTFATRDLVRTLHEQTAYYVLVLSRDKARLIEALNDKTVAENDGIFPIGNTSLYPQQPAEAAIASRQTNLTQEFFNMVDKRLYEAIKENPLPVLLSTEESNYPQYLKVADRKHMIVGNLNGNRMEEKAHHIIDAAWPIVQHINKDKNRRRLEELSAAQGSGRVLVDFSDIWRAVNEGRGQTIFVQQGYFQPARLVGNAIELVDQQSLGKTDIIDDVIDEMIEINLRQGGDSVFLAEDALKDYQGLALTTRY